MDTGKLFVGAIFLLVAIYLFTSQTDFTAKYFGGGIMVILGLFLFIMPACQKKTKKTIKKKRKPKRKKRKR